MSLDRARGLFARAFGAPPVLVASAPGRVNLIGEHTDYNGGEVLPIAIVRRTYVAARPNGGAESRAISATESDTGSFDPCRPARAGRWWDYVAGVADQLTRHHAAPVSCDIAVWSDVPAGAGLSSSAALEVAAGLALTHASGAEVELRELALWGQRAESEFAGVACGIMDQFASALATVGHALHLFCNTGETEQVAMPESVLIFDTAVPRSLRGSAFNVRRAECEQALALLRREYPHLRTLAEATPEQVRSARLPDPLDRRALHVAEETRRVRRMVASLRSGTPTPGELLLASHESLRANYECSSPELDWFVERALCVPAVRGARLTGAGWGGCAIALGDERALAEAALLMAADYERAFRRTPRYWISHAANGAALDWMA